jgi:tRNA(Ile)-lysidine synthase
MYVNLKHTESLAKDPYIYRFLAHTWDFINAENSPRNVVVSCSGGADSTALLLAAYIWQKQEKLKTLRVVHFNYHTRGAESDLEEKKVSDLCQYLGISLIVKRFSLSLTQKNFEATARQMRKSFLKTIISQDEWIFEGHQLNDSFEWSLMQQFKSSDTTKILGIPYRSGATLRPFMAVSRAQIETFLKRLGIEGSVDSSNFNLKFERNWMRQEISQKIIDRYPSALKNYVTRMNRLYKVDKTSKKNEEDFTVLARNADEHSILLALQNLSTESRGKWRGQLQNLINAKKNEISGPYLFSGGVMALATPEYFIFYRQEKVLELTDTGPNPLFVLLNSKNFKDLSLKKCPDHFLLKENLTENSRLIPYPRWKKVLSEKKSLAQSEQVRYLGIA